MMVGSQSQLSLLGNRYVGHTVSELLKIWGQVEVLSGKCEVQTG